MEHLQPSVDTMPSEALLPAGLEILSFRLGTESYGVDIHRVQEIRSYERPTPLVQAPASVRGVIPLRGHMVPVLDLRVRLGLPAQEVGPSTVVIVVRIGEGDDALAGLVVDRVSDVVQLTPAQVRPLPGLRAGAETRHLQALGALPDCTVLLLDVDALLAPALAATDTVSLH